MSDLDFDAAFAAFADPSAGKGLILTQQQNYCKDCDIAMEMSGTEYHCAFCGYTLERDSECVKNHSESTSAAVRITIGANKGRFYNVNSDYTRAQKKVILLQMTTNQKNYKGAAIPYNVILNTANQYNAIQKTTTNEVDATGATITRKFVKRGAIKNEILAAILYFECIRAGVTRKKKDIAIFMGLGTNGFSRGENILRNLESEGKVEIPIDEEPISGFADRYLEALSIDNKYNQFVVDLVELSEDNLISMSSQIASKIVGAIWVLIEFAKLGITPAQLETAADNTKKNTFMKFRDTVMNNWRLFAPVFIKHGLWA